MQVSVAARGTAKVRRCEKVNGPNAELLPSGVLVTEVAAASSTRVHCSSSPTMRSTTTKTTTTATTASRFCCAPRRCACDADLITRSTCTDNTAVSFRIIRILCLASPPLPGYSRSGLPHESCWPNENYLVSGMLFTRARAASGQSREGWRSNDSHVHQGNEANEGLRARCCFVIRNINPCTASRTQCPHCHPMGIR